MAELTLRANRPKGDNRTFFRGGIEIPGSWTRMEIEDGRKKALQEESMVLVAEDMKPADIVEIVKRLEDVNQIKALAEAKPSAKTVQEAVAARLEALNYEEKPEGEEVPTREELEKNRDAFIEKIKACTSLEALHMYANDIIGWEDTTTHKELSDAYEAREKELKG